MLITAACSSGTKGEPTDETVERESEGIGLTVEEAGLVASGELVRIYGSEVDPVPVEVEASRDTVDGQPAWRLEIVAEVGTAERRREDWTLWVAIRDDEAVVVRSAGPR